MNSENETKQEQDWEALGRAAVEAGMPFKRYGGAATDAGRLVRVILHDGMCETSSGGDLLNCYPEWPDFRDRLTSKACELWVEDVALEVDGVSDSIAFCYGDFEGLHTVRFWKNGLPFSRSASTRPEACIAAVKAMRGSK